MSYDTSRLKSQKWKFFQSIAQDNSFRDVTLASDDGQTLKVHKLVLCAASKFLSELFLNLDNNERYWIHLGGVEHQGLKDIVKFLYVGEVVISEANMSDFLKVSELLAVESAFNIVPNTSISKPKEVSFDTGNEEKPLSSTFSDQLFKRKNASNVI